MQRQLTTTIQVWRSVGVGLSVLRRRRVRQMVRRFTVYCGDERSRSRRDDVHCWRSRQRHASMRSSVSQAPTPAGFYAHGNPLQSLTFSLRYMVKMHTSDTMAYPEYYFWGYKHPAGNSSHSLSCPFGVKCMAILGV